MSPKESHTAPVALVTGANRGLGKECARQLAALGYEVILSARRLEDADNAANELRKSGAKATALALDVTAPATIAAAAAEVDKRFGRLDALVNNAGISGKGFETRIENVEVGQILTTFETNTLGPLRTTQA